MSDQAWTIAAIAALVAVIAAAWLATTRRPRAERRTAIDFAAMSDHELALLGRAIDALTREEPGLIHSDGVWTDVVHAWAAESGHRYVQDVRVPRGERP